MFWNRKRKQDKPVWRDENGKIYCPGDNCPNDCDTSCPIWLNTCGLEKLMSDQAEQAICDFQRAIALAPDFPDAHNNLASSYGMCNRHQEAYDEFSKALALRKDYPQALRGLIAAEKNLGKYSDALMHCCQYEKITGNSTQSLRDEIKGRMTMKYLDLKGIKAAFAEHLIKHRGYSKEEAAIAVSDFPDPFLLPYLDEDYIGDETINGLEYHKNASYTSFWKCGIKGIPMFRFYTYYAVEDIPTKKVIEYQNARKLYQVSDLNDDDFPSEEDMDEEASRTIFI